MAAAPSSAEGDPLSSSTTQFELGQRERQVLKARAPSNIATAGVEALNGASPSSALAGMIAER
jgi:hypothetical protein